MNSITPSLLFKLHIILETYQKEPFILDSLDKICPVKCVNNSVCVCLGSYAHKVLTLKNNLKDFYLLSAFQ